MAISECPFCATQWSDGRVACDGLVCYRAHPRGSLANYEQRKAAWQAAHPTASAAEYQAAMTRIAREAGV
jgi:hypothetical protein